MKKRTSSKTLLKPKKYQHVHLSGRSRGPPQTTKITPGGPLGGPRGPPGAPKIDQKILKKKQKQFLKKFPKIGPRDRRKFERRTSKVRKAQDHWQCKRLRKFERRKTTGAFRRRHSYGAIGPQGTPRYTEFLTVRSNFYQNF